MFYFKLSQVKVLTNPGSNVPLATPVAISTTLPPKVSALYQQGSNALPVPASHRTNTSTHTPFQAQAHVPAPSCASESPALQLFLRQLSAYVKGTPPFFSLRLLPISVLLGWLPCVANTVFFFFHVYSPRSQRPSAQT